MLTSIVLIWLVIGLVGALIWRRLDYVSWLGVVVSTLLGPVVIIFILQTLAALPARRAQRAFLQAHEDANYAQLVSLRRGR